MDLKGKTALITGGCGLIGSTIADQLIRDEQIGKIVILDNLTRGTLYNIEWARKHGNVELVQKDIRHFDRIRPHFEGVDAVFHQAAIRITACAEQPRECLDVLVTGSFNAAQACVEAKVKKLVAASSASIYGAADSFPTREDHHPYNNRTWYGAAKIANEGTYRSFNDMYGLPYVALRYFNVYGPRMDVFGKYTEVLIRWLDCLDKGDKPKIFGDGKATMDFIFSEDRERGRQYAEQRQRRHLEETAATVEDFYRSLQQELEITSATTQSALRVAQLTQKTNQFNLTTRRYTEQQILDMATDPKCRVLGASVRDRFGDSGMVGVVITRDSGDVCEIDTFLLSCRVIGRTVETAMLACQVAEAQARGIRKLRGWFLPTKKNAPAKDFYSAHGFGCSREVAEGSLWELDLPQAQIKCPDWIKLARKQ